MFYFYFLFSLRLALEKDPEYLQAMVILGQALYQKEQFAEAATYLERAASKVLSCCSLISFLHIHFLIKMY